MIASFRKRMQFLENKEIGGVLEKQRRNAFDHTLLLRLRRFSAHGLFMPKKLKNKWGRYIRSYDRS